MSVLRGQCCIKCNLVTAICVKIYIMWGTVLRSSVCGAPVLAMSAPDAVPMQGTGRDPRPKPHNDDDRSQYGAGAYLSADPQHFGKLS